MAEAQVKSGWRALPYILLGLAVVLFVLQLRSLFVFPVPNSVRWFGDETWLMSEARQQLATGIVTYPLAIGSQLVHGKGLILSMTWLSSLLYGLPILVTGADPVAVGRCVTAILALILFIALYYSSRSLGASRSASALIILLLLSTRSFFFTSHSARPDLLAGLLVVLVVTWFSHASEHSVARGGWWWFCCGASLAFIAVSSSIHLVTLMAPVAFYFIWRMTNGKRRMVAAFVQSATGALASLVILAIVYYFTTNSLHFFPPSAKNGQFHDVLHAIPILHPFSRSVQFANIVIRLKQLLLESSIIFLLPLLGVISWKKELVRNSFVIAVVIVTLSWLLLEGAEVNYLIHLLPLLFVALALAITRAERMGTTFSIIFCALGLLEFGLGVKDTITACSFSSKLDNSNRFAVQMVEDSIGSTCHGQDKPRVLTEPPTLERFLQDTSLRIITDHFISFPERAEPYDTFFVREHIDYAVLYNSPSYPKIRPLGDPFYQAVARSGRLIGRYVGMSGDVGREYFHPSNWMDTILLFQFNQAQ